MRISIFLTLITLCFVGCVTPTSQTNTDEILYTPTYAKGFELLKRGDTITLITKNPWQGAQNINKLYQFTEPHKSLVCMSSSHTAFLDALGLDSVVIAVSGPQYLYNKAHTSKTDIGYDSNLSIETIAALKPSAMTVYDVSGAGTAQNEKLETLSVPIIYIADFLEQSPLGRAEWIVAFGALTGKFDEAKSLFSEIEANYNQMKKAENNSKKIKVMLNTPYRDVWYAAGDSSYIVTLINDAGGDYIVKNSSAGQAISLETAYRLIAEADIWLNPSAHIKSRKQLFEENPRFKQVKIPVFTNMRRTTPAGGSDFWESAVVRPDLVLNDLTKIFSNDTTNLYYYKQLL